MVFTDVDYLIHVVTREDRVVFVDCIPRRVCTGCVYTGKEACSPSSTKNQTLIEKSATTEEAKAAPIWNALQPYFLVLKDTQLQKNHVYRIRLQAQYSEVFNPEHLEVLLQTDGFAYALIGDNLEVYSYSLVSEEDNEYLYTLARTPLCAPSLKDEFMAADIAQQVDAFSVFSSGEGLASGFLNAQQKPVLMYDMGYTPSFLKGNAGKRFKLDTSCLQWLVISHRHMDHYNYFLRYIEQLRATKLIINSNVLSLASLTLRKIYRTFAKNHQLYMLTQPVVQHIATGFITLFLADNPTYNETGVQAAHEGSSCMLYTGKPSIFMMGDNYLDDIRFNELGVIDYLQATHHGSTFTRSTYQTIPMSTGKSVLMIPSSCEHYNHPDHVEEYSMRGWKTQLYTQVKTITIHLK